MSSFDENFSLVRCLGEGAFAEVWETEEKSTGRRFAVKILEAIPLGKRNKCNEEKKIQSTNISELCSKHKDEIECLKILQSHPNIVHLHRVILSHDKIHLVQQLAECGDLFDLLCKSATMFMNEPIGVCESEAYKYFYDLVNAVNFMHSCGISHRDIKIENCLVDKNGNILLTDFGFATRNKSSNRRCGTLQYFSPEMILSKSQKNNQDNNDNENDFNNEKKSQTKAKYFDPFACDVWACGIVFYYLLTSRLPFGNTEDESREDIKQQIINKNVFYPSYLSFPTIQLLERMLEKNPLKRCTIYDVFNHPIFSQLKQNQNHNQFQNQNQFIPQQQ
eukprot:c20308_g6_i1.p1 GENE.c20308_g6_i1~~c20308_g6_i1.p1  ORF type:complete len:334 (-),score=128.17 c20308_g6_i1:90-1091(-)